ncbi:MAG TPA: hypothetical protein VFX06_10145 [Stellaceae bacterium]|nr:hypothetical protein [Stellaceae bacterium]
MNLPAILARLPASLEWAAIFNLNDVLAIAPATIVRQMFFLPEGQDVAPYSHIALTAAGGVLAPRLEGALCRPEGGAPIAPAAGEDTLRDRYEALLRPLSWDDAMCLGLGRAAPFPPVAMAVERLEDHAVATAVLAARPSTAHFELLEACGVRFLGCDQEGNFFRARFRNALDVHLFSGMLAAFGRTGNCNRFFLRHADIDAQLAAGLIGAGRARVAAARAGAYAVLARLAAEARRGPLAMTCVSPGAAPAPYGDLVPLGFLARALAASAERPHQAAAELVRRHLRARSEDGLWAFHSGGLPTATDSSLVLLGVGDQDAVERLERFGDGGGGYLPQRAAAVRRPGYMQMTEANRHWCQPDLATTCLVRALRRNAGLSEKTPLCSLERAFDRRSGLFFANPHLMDWVFALAIRDDPDASELRDRLCAEMRASARPDYSFGGYDVALSTALAILTLAALGARGRLLHCAQVRLAGLIGETGQWPAATPFYSTLAGFPDAVGQPGLLRPGHALSLYEDTCRIIVTSLVALALGEICDPALRDLPTGDGEEAAPRYRCTSVGDYVSRFALPPYLAAAREAT